MNSANIVILFIIMILKDSCQYITFVHLLGLFSRFNSINLATISEFFLGNIRAFYP